MQKSHGYMTGTCLASGLILLFFTDRWAGLGLALWAASMYGIYEKVKRG